MTQFAKIFSDTEKKTIKEVLKVVNEIFIETTKKEPKLFLIGMKALYYYF